MDPHEAFDQPRRRSAPTPAQVAGFQSSMDIIEGVTASGAGEDESGPYFFVDCSEDVAVLVPRTHAGLEVRMTTAPAR